MRSHQSHQQAPATGWNRSKPSDGTEETHSEWERHQSTLNHQIYKLTTVSLKGNRNQSRRPETSSNAYQTSTGPLGTGIADLCAAAGSCMNDATIGAGRYCGFNSPASSTNCCRQRR